MVVSWQERMKSASLSLLKWRDASREVEILANEDVILEALLVLMSETSAQIVIPSVGTNKPTCISVTMNINFTKQRLNWSVLTVIVHSLNGPI